MRRFLVSDAALALTSGSADVVATDSVYPLRVPECMRIPSSAQPTLTDAELKRDYRTRVMLGEADGMGPEESDDAERLAVKRAEYASVCEWRRRMRDLRSDAQEITACRAEIEFLAERVARSEALNSDQGVIWRLDALVSSYEKVKDRLELQRGERVPEEWREAFIRALLVTAIKDVRLRGIALTQLRQYV